VDTGEKQDLLVAVKRQKLYYSEHTVWKPGSCLEKDLIQGTTPGREHRGWTVLNKCCPGLAINEQGVMSSSQSRHRRLVHDTAKP